ncbi:MAG: diguanylate cyclase [Polyangiaceae bacterium]|nr:diguanylate cyclase [Polyangiaceae bacterium]
MPAPPHTPYSAALLVAGMACLAVALAILRHRHVAGGRPLAALTFALAWWDLTYALFWAQAPAPSPYFWLDATYVGVVMTPPALLIFTLEFAGQQRRVRGPLLAGLALEPVLVLVALWTDPWHNLFFAGQRAQNTSLILDAGPVFWANVVYGYLLVAMGFGVLWLHRRSAAGVHRSQTTMMLMAVAIPWLSSMMFVAGLQPFPAIDNTPLAFSLTALIVAWGLVRYGMLDVVPIAREILLDEMPDAMLVLDARKRVVDMNPAARALLPGLDAGHIGRHAEVVLTSWPEVIHGLDSSEESARLHDDAGRWFDLRISRMKDPRGLPLGYLLVWRDVSALQAANAELEALASRDPLTQVFNRRQFFLLAERELLRAERKGTPLTLALLDIDHFKLVNDTHGHQTGDEVLIGFVQRCQGVCRATDVLARYGGEEFVLLLPETGGSDASAILERILQALRAAPLETTKTPIEVRCSAGLACWSGPAESLQSLVGRADEALYLAKQQGRNRVVEAPRPR